jgi:hypothetical protein
MEPIWTPVTDPESGEVYVPDRHNVGTALSLARTAFALSNAVIILYMAIIQYLLLRIRFSKSKIKPPKCAEQLLAVIILWGFHRLFDVSLSACLDTIVQVAWNEEVALHYQRLRYGPAFDIGYWVLVPVAWTWWNNIHLISWEVLVTWFLYSNISMGIFLTPLSLEARQNPRRVFKQCNRRFLELVGFIRMMFQEPDPILHFLSRGSFEKSDGKDIKKIGQAVQLQRRHDEFPVDGQRTLNWDVRVDKEALGEMMETLGPPGGFGELGFSITAGKVCFGAMGVGTRFNLNFVLEEDGKEGAKEK